MMPHGRILAALLPALWVCLRAPAYAAELPAYGKVDAMTQALNTQMCLSCNYDGNLRGGEVAAVRVGGWESGKKSVLTGGQNLWKKTAKALRFGRHKPDLPVPQLEYGPLKDRPEEKKPDVNRWNNVIEGANGAYVVGVIGLILGGPVGLLLGAAVGFLLMYYGRQNNDR